MGILTLLWHSERTHVVPAASWNRSPCRGGPCPDLRPPKNTIGPKKEKQGEELKHNIKRAKENTKSSSGGTRTLRSTGHKGIVAQAAGQGGRVLSVVWGYKLKIAVGSISCCCCCCCCLPSLMPRFAGLWIRNMRAVQRVVTTVTEKGLPCSLIMMTTNEKTSSRSSLLCCWLWNWG